MGTMTAEKASTQLQEKRKGYKKLSGEELKSALISKNDAMSCVKEDEIHLASTRRLKVNANVIWDVTDEKNPREVPSDEIYLIGWK